MMLSWRIFGAVFLFLACFAVFPMAVVGWGFTHLPGDLVDSRLNNYLLEHGYRSLILGEGEFWHPTFCYPARGVMACSDSHLGNLPIYAVFRAVGAGPERAFQLWWLATFPLTYAAGICGARWIGLRWFGACLAAAVFTFSPLMAANLAHVQLFPRYFIPLAVGYLWLFLRDAKAKHLLATVLCWVGQLYCSFYLAYFLGLFLGFLAIAAVGVGAVSWRPLLWPRLTEWLKRLAILAAVPLLLWPAIRPYTMPDRQKLSPPPDVARMFLPQPVDWLYPHPTSGLWQGVGRLWEPVFPYSRHVFPGGAGFLGVAAGAAAILGWVFLRRRREFLRTPAAWAVALFAMGLLFLAFFEYSLYNGALKLPLVAGLRATHRVALIFLWPMALLFGGLAERCGRGLALGLALFVVVEAVAVKPEKACWNYSIADAVERQDRFAEELRKHTEAKCFYLFPGVWDAKYYEMLAVQLDAMVAGQRRGVPTCNGWTGQWPNGWDCFENYSMLAVWIDRNGGTDAEWAKGLVIFGTPMGTETDPRAEPLRQRFPAIPWKP